MIASAAMKHRFEAEEKDLEVEEHKLANELLDSQFTSSDLKLLNSLPAGWTARSLSVHTQIYGGTTHLRLGKSRNIPSQMEYSIKGCTDELSKFVRKKNALRDVRNSAFSAMMGMLNKVQTTKRLAEVWPEIVPFIPKDVVQADKSAALALPITTLNQMLKLP